MEDRILTTGSEHTRTAHAAVLLLRGLAVSAIRLSLATPKPLERTLSSVTRTMAGSSSAILQGAQKTHEATGCHQGWLSSHGDQFHQDELTLLILAALFILLVNGLRIPPALGLPVPRALGERPTPRLLLRDAPLSLWAAILVLWYGVLVLRKTVLVLILR